MAGTTPKTNKKTSKPKGENGKSKSLKDEINKQVDAAEKKAQEIEEKNKPNPSDVANDLGKADEQVNFKGKTDSTKSSKTAEKSDKGATPKAEPESKTESKEESKGKEENPTKEAAKATTEEPKATTGIDPNKALNPNDFEAGTGAKDSSMDLYTRFASIDPKNLTDPYGKPIDWNSVDGKSDIAISLGDRVLTIPKELAMDMANSVKNNQYDRASLTVARSLGLEAKPDTNAAYVLKGNDLSKQGEKYLKKLMEDPNTPGLAKRLLTYILNNPKKSLTGLGIGALGTYLYNRAKDDENNAEAADKALEDDTPIDDIDSALNGVPKEEDTTPEKLAEELVSNSDTEVGAASINGHTDGENGESDNPDSIEQASDNLNEAINGIPSHLPQDVPDEEEGKEAAAKEYNPTYTPKQEMYDSLNTTAEPKGAEPTLEFSTTESSEAEPTSTENTVDQLKAADNVSNGGSVSTSAPAKTRAKVSKATPVNNVPMAGSRPDVSAPGYGAAALSAALGQAAQGAPVDGYDRMFDPSFLEYMRRVSPNTAYGIEQEMRRRGMM